MQERARSSIKTLVQAKVIYTAPLFYAAKGLWYIKQNKSSTVTLNP